MAIMEGLIGSVIFEIAKKAGDAGWKKAKHSSKVLEILNEVGLKPEKPEPNFDSVYAHTLVAYGVDQPEEVLKFFNRKEIKKAFGESFRNSDISLLESEAETFIEWNEIGDELRDSGVELRLEFARFTLVFNEMVDRTRTPVEMIDGHKLDEILRMIKEGGLYAIRTKNIEIQRQSLSKTKHTFKVFVSSTSRDNEERRKVVQDAIVRAGMVWDGMEVFTAEKIPTKDVCLKYAVEADLFVGIIAHRYGWQPDGGKSITEMEYDIAKAAGKDCFMFQLNPKIGVNLERDIDEGEDKWDKQKKLESFKKRFAEDQLSTYFEENTLGTKVLSALNKWREARELGNESTGVVATHMYCADEIELTEEVKSYCQKADALYAYLPVAGFVTQLKVPIDIDEIYVPMRAMLNLSGQGTTFSDSDHAEKGLRDKDVGHEIPLPVAFQEARKRKRKGLVILGDPGSGKTTHLKRLMLGCIRKGSDELNLPSGMAPVFLPLRELRDLDHGLDMFIVRQLDSSNLKASKGFGERLLKRQNLLFLLDGLDEVADLKQRERVASWILDAIPAYPTCRFVVTCRFAGYSPTVQMSADFLEMHVRPFNGQEAERFVRNWYKAVELGLAKDTEQAEVIAGEKADRLLKRLKESDFRTSKVFELTRNPLLLTNICLVHRHRNDLPHKRAKLYEECIDVLLEHWRKAKELRVWATAQDRRRVLQPAALWMHGRDGRTRAKASELAPIIKLALKAIGSDELDALKFLEAIRDDSGLLTGWDQEHYGFMHLGFQEYLVAREIRSRAFKDKDVLRDLASHFGESWWQEVTLIMLALEDPSLFEDFMEEVVKLPAFASNPSLVDMCLEDAAETSVQPFMDVINENPGKNEELWKRQAAALRVVKRLDESVLETIKDRLVEHPSREISQWFNEYSQEESSKRNVVTAKQGGYELIRIPGGSFMMGSPESEEGRYGDESPQHEVSVPEFYMGVAPVTNRQYGIFMAENTEVTEPEYWADRRFNQPEQPVVGVSWEDVIKYAEWAGLRLPTEAEWEYSCRAGITTRYYLGDEEGDLKRAGWYTGNSSGQSHPVGEKAMNGFGLYDMHGNVWEWVEDDWHENYHGAPDNGNAWIDKKRGSYRVIRGGSWHNVAQSCRSAFRNNGVPGFRNYGLGFRLSRSVTLGT